METSSSSRSSMSSGTPPASSVDTFYLDSKKFKQLLDTQTLIDCTLACDGGKISAHKIVLSACSSYLAKILAEHPVEHPIIILPELNIDDVRTLVHYMYTGELLKLNYPFGQHSSSLLRTAAILSVNSLNDFLAEPASSNLNTSSGGSSTNSAAILAASSINHHLQQQQHHHNNNNNNTPATTNTTSGPINTTTTTTSNNSNSNSNSTSSNNNNHYFGTANVTTNNATGAKSEFQFKCPVCQNDFQTICSFEYHMQRVHKVTSFGCEICHKPFASLRYVLTDHMRRCHGWKPEQKLAHQY